MSEGCDYENLCLELIDMYWWGVALEAVMLIFGFVALAVVADSRLVVSLETLCVRWNVPGHVAGASFMAFGSSAPEIVINAVTTIKSFSGDPDGNDDDIELGLSAIIGSGMIAFTVIPYLCTLSTPMSLELRRGPVLRDSSFYLVSLAILSYLIRQEGGIAASAALGMIGLYVVYMMVVVCASKIRARMRTVRDKRALDPEAVELSNLRPSLAESVLRDRPTLMSVLDHTATESLIFESKSKSRNSVSKRGNTDMSLEVPQSMELPASEASEDPPSQCEVFCTRVTNAGGCLMRPFFCLLNITCPECEHDSPQAWKYPITFVTGILWVTVLSFVLAAVVTRWGILSGVPTYILGLIVIAGGAEIPDAIQSIAVARRGRGTMAVSNATGSQILNILIGLGMPWFISALAGMEISVDLYAQLNHMAAFQVVNVAIYMALTLGPVLPVWIRGGTTKATLDHNKGKVLGAAYIINLLIYMVFFPHF